MVVLLTISPVMNILRSSHAWFIRILTKLDFQCFFFLSNFLLLGVAMLFFSFTNLFPLPANDAEYLDKYVS